MSENKPTYREGDRKNGDIMEHPATRMTTALVLIGLGLLFLLNQMNVLTLRGNWWAFLIAIPAVALLYSAYRAYNRVGQLTPEVGSSLTGGIIFAGIALMAWFDAWEWLLPFILILIGISMLLGWRNPERGETQR